MMLNYSVGLQLSLDAYVGIYKLSQDLVSSIFYKYLYHIFMDTY